MIQKLFFVFAILVATSAAASDEYRLGAGDKVKVIVFDEPDLSGEFELGGAGGLSLPLIGAMPALELSPQELEARVEAKLLDGYLLRPRVSIEVLSYRPFYIMGEVNQPG